MPVPLVPMLDFVPALSPQFERPDHLAEWCAILERCLTEPVRGLCSVPIRHFKTQTTLAGVVWLLLRDPTLRFILMSFDHERSEWLGHELKTLCERADSFFGSSIGPERGQNKKIQWTNKHGGGVAAMSADQSREGHDVDILIVDDPMTELAADDLTIRDRVDAAIAHYSARAGRPGRKGSVLLIMSRLAVDDPMGRRMTRTIPKWDVVEYAAIVNMGEPDERAWAPNVMTLEELHERRAEWAQQDPSERGFFARFMNRPRSASVQLFKPNPARYDKVPVGRVWPIIGLDLAYTIDPHSDWFAMVVLLRHENGLAYVVNVVREKRDLQRAAIVLHQAKRQWPGAAFYTYASGPEKGSIQYMADAGVGVEWLQARYDKSTRARRTVDAWNADRIVVPLIAGWDVPGFVSRCNNFTGLNKAGNDDEIDALVSACDGGLFSAGMTPKAFGKMRL